MSKNVVLVRIALKIVLLVVDKCKIETKLHLVLVGMDSMKKMEIVYLVITTALPARDQLIFVLLVDQELIGLCKLLCVDVL